MISNHNGNNPNPLSANGENDVPFKIIRPEEEESDSGGVVVEAVHETPIGDCNEAEMQFSEEYPSSSHHKDKDKDITKHDFTQQFSSKNAKIISCCIVCGFVLYHTILRLFHGIDTCQWLLSDGNFRDQVWQPYGCMMHHYNHLDARRCMKYMEYWGTNNHFVFVGDSRMEQVYHAFIHQIVPTYEYGDVHPPRPGLFAFSSTMITPNFTVKMANRDMSYNDSQIGLRVQYLFLPYPNKTMISALQQWKTKKEWPKTLVIGTGSWTIRDSKTNPVELLLQSDYASVVTHLTVVLDGLVEAGVDVLWAVQEPTDSNKLSGDWAVVTNDKIDAFNYLFQKVLRYSKVKIWSSGKLVAGQNLEDSPDGYHLGWKTLIQDAQILLNMYCNDNMNYNDATCCSNLEKVSNLQLVTFVVLGISFLLLCILFIRKHWRRLFPGSNYNNYAYQRLKYNGYSNYEAQEKASEMFYRPVAALGKLAVIMAFFFICDRTTMFMKENKYFTQTNFWLPVIYILVLGIFFTEDSPFTKVLHYDQDNEMKGWMVLLILVYNMMGASQVLPIFMFVKILYSAFLFLHGWNQFLSFLQRGEYTFVRFLRDLFRLNLMTVLLCLCMNRPYQFYDFIPLISFWTLVAFIGLSIPPRVKWTCDSNYSLNYLYLVLKLIGIFSFTTILYMSEVFFEKVFITRPWKALFVSTDDDIHDWWTRWKIDRYSVPVGMLVALGYHVGKKYKIVEDDNHGHLFTTRISLLAALFSLMGMGAYGTFSVFCRNQLECIEIHSYVAFIPIAGYILVRNVSGALRTRFSAFFAWFGQFWVELLVGQYHVWMGADGHGVLVLVPAYPVGNVLLTAFVFACTAHEIRKCTDALLPYAVPEDWKKAARNLILFLLVLIPIGIHDGMF